MKWPIKINASQWRSHNDEKVRHIKGELLDQAVILFNCVPLQSGTSLKGRSEFFHLRVVPYSMEN